MHHTTIPTAAADPSYFVEPLQVLSRTIGLPVALNDENMLPVASTPHEGALDRSRMHLLLGRPVPPLVAEVFQTREKISQTRAPSRIAPFAGLELGRIHVPLRGDTGRVSGHLWVIDPDHAVPLDDIVALQEKAEQALSPGLAQRQQSSVFGSQPAEGEDLGWMRILRLRTAPSLALAKEGRTAIQASDLIGAGFGHGEQGVRVAGRRLDDGDYLVTAAGAGGTITAAWFAQALGDAGRGLSGRTPMLPPVVAALSPLLPADGNSEACAVALGIMVEMAANAAESSTQVHLLVDDNLFDLLSELGPVISTPGWIPPSIRRLIAEPRSATLANTAKVFLDVGGSAAKAARLLGVHRGTLYYRLDQVESITGLQFDDGRHRLLLHLGLTMSTIQGVLGAA